MSLYPGAITIAVESPLTEEMRGLIAQLNQALLALTPREFCHHLTVEQMAGTDTTVFAAREGAALVACGALKRHGGGPHNSKIGEVKRMYTLPSHQGRGIGGKILDAIEAKARDFHDLPPSGGGGLTHLVLETGNNFVAAQRLYLRHGFVRVPGPVLDYPASPYTAFYEKPLCTGVSA